MGLCINRKNTQGGFLGEINQDIMKGYMLCHDPFTAAIFSGSREMIRYIGEALGDIFWNDSMGRSIAYSEEAIQDYLLENYPEIADYLSLSVILEARSRKLLDAVMERRKGDKTTWDELYDSLKKAADEMDMKRQSWRPELELKRELEWKCQVNLKEEKLFLKKMFDYIPTDEIRASLQEFILMEGLSEENEQRAGMLLNIFFWAGNTKTRDYTKAMLRVCGSGGMQWRRLKLLAKAGGIGVDLYAEAAEELSAILAKYEEMKGFLGAACPLEIRNETDVYTQYVVDTNQAANVKKAIQEGAITARNALAVYEYAAGVSCSNEYILDMLVRLAQTREVKEWYVEEME